MSVTFAPGYMPAAVPCFQWQAEFEILLDMYRRRNPTRVLEVGTYHGGTLYHWLANASPGAVVVSVDHYRVGVDNRESYDAWCPPGVTLVVIDGDSGDETTRRRAEAWGPYEWVFIDAGHYYPEVKRDWEFYGSMAAPGGVVAFHDILPPTPAHPEIEVAQLWEEVKASRETTEIVADRDAEWGGIGVVFVD